MFESEESLYKKVLLSLSSFFDKTYGSDLRIIIIIFSYLFGCVAS